MWDEIEDSDWTESFTQMFKCSFHMLAANTINVKVKVKARIQFSMLEKRLCSIIKLNLNLFAQLLGLGRHYVLLFGGVK